MTEELPGSQGAPVQPNGSHRPLNVFFDVDNTMMVGASIFHFAEHTVAEAKDELQRAGVIVRPV